MIDPSEEYFEIKKIINHEKINTIPKKQFNENNIPTYVATPFPPLSFSQIGNTCPMKADKDEM